MSASFLVSYGVLWLLVLSMGYMLLQGRLLSRATGTGPLIPGEQSGLAVGSTFPFSAVLPPDAPPLQELPTLVLVTASGCAPCKPLLNLLPQWIKQNRGVQVVVLMVGKLEHVLQAEREFDSPVPFYPATVEQMKVIQTTGAPFAYVVSSTGLVKARGYAGSDVQLTFLLQQALPEVA